MGAMRVLLLTKGLGPGGAERLLVEQAGARAPGVDYEAAYLLPWKQHLVGELEGLGVPTHCLGVRNEADPRWLLRLARLLRTRRFDVVHAHSPVSASLARVLVRAGFRSTAFVVHRAQPLAVPPPGDPRARTARPSRSNDAVIAVSADVAASMTPRARARAEVITHGIDLAGGAGPRRGARGRARRARGRSRRRARGDGGQPAREQALPGSPRGGAPRRRRRRPGAVRGRGPGSARSGDPGRARAPRPRRPLRAPRVPRRRATR